MLHKRAIHYIVSLVLAYAIFIQLSVAAFASEVITKDTRTSFVSAPVPEGVVDYAIREFEGLLKASFISIDEWHKYRLSEFVLYSPFAPVNQDGTVFIYYFPVCVDGRVVGILSIARAGEDYGISLGTSFSARLNTLLSTQDEYTIVSYSGNLLAVADSTSYHLEGTMSIEADTGSCYTAVDESVVRVYTEELYRVNLSFPTLLYDPDEPLEHGILDIKPVLQIGINRCWAACCAMIINFKKGTSLTAGMVSYAVNNHVEDVPGTWEDMKAAYNLWHLYPGRSPGGPIQYLTIKNKIDNKDPIHMGLALLDEQGEIVPGRGHSIVLCGYFRLRDGKYITVIDPYDAEFRSIKITYPHYEQLYTYGSVVFKWTEARFNFWTPPEEEGLLPDIQYPWLEGES